MPESPEAILERALSELPPTLQEPLRVRWAELAPLWSAAPDPARWAAALPRVFACSEFVARACLAHPGLLPELLAGAGLYRADAPGELAGRVRAAIGEPADEAGLKQRLRGVRRREMVRIAWRDLAGWATLDEVLAALSDLADACIDAAASWLYREAVRRHGEPRGEGGAPATLAVLGMGKLGGRELNFSSDVDLIFAYTEDGGTAGAARALSNHEFFLRLGQALIDALAQTTAEGFVFRVDMRLRPNGEGGPLALCFDATEQYYQTHGREWERYALIKARPVAGDLAAGAALLARLRPFVYRKYLDYGAVEAIRELKLMIDRELARKGMGENIKLGPGGIREIEFIGQSFQLIRGGREPALRAREILAVIARLAERGDLTAQAAADLTAAYRFLRAAENRLQMIADRQTHVLPADDPDRARLAAAMGYAEWPAFETALRRHMHKVHGHFTQVFAAPQAEPATADAALAGVWAGELEPSAAARALARAGYPRPDEALALLTGLRAGAAYVAASAEGRARLDRLMPLLVAAAGLTADPQTALARLVGILEAIGRRSAYLALLVEHPMVLSQLVRLAAASPWIANWISQHPIILDELLDPVGLYAPASREALSAELASRSLELPLDDLEAWMELLREFRHGHVLRVAAADIGPGLAPEAVGAHLADIAEVVLEQVLRLARASLADKHGRPRCEDPGAPPEPGFAIIAYGKLGSREMGYGSDLDVIFLYQGCPSGDASDGPRAIPNELYFARLGQRVIHILTTRTPSGVLYPVDMRLRPSGQAGPLVTSLAAFQEYQRSHAWTWEHQALMRARPVAGEPALLQGFADVRREILCRARDPERLRAEVREMREKMRAAQPPHDPARFDVKHDPGGIVDIEFMVQYWVLRWAHAYPALAAHTDNIHLLEELAAAGLVEAGRARHLAEAYRRYLSLEHRLKLMERGALTERRELGERPGEVAAVWREVMGG